MNIGNGDPQFNINTSDGITIEVKGLGELSLEGTVNNMLIDGPLYLFHGNNLHVEFNTITLGVRVYAGDYSVVFKTPQGDDHPAWTPKVYGHWIEFVEGGLIYSEDKSPVL